MESKFINARELGVRWGISPVTLRDWRWKAKGPKYFKMSSRTAYRLEDIEEFERTKEIPKKKKSE